jgi:hypothetical protein
MERLASRMITAEQVQRISTSLCEMPAAIALQRHSDCGVNQPQLSSCIQQAKGVECIKTDKRVHLPNVVDDTSPF